MSAIKGVPFNLLNVNVKADIPQPHVDDFRVKE